MIPIGARDDTVCAPLARRRPTFGPMMNAIARNKCIIILLYSCRRASVSTRGRSGRSYASGVVRRTDGPSYDDARTLLYEATLSARDELSARNLPTGRSGRWAALRRRPRRGAWRTRCSPRARPTRRPTLLRRSWAPPTGGRVSVAARGCTCALRRRPPPPVLLRFSGGAVKGACNG